MAWIELHQTLPSHRKTLRLRRLLQIRTPQAVGHLCMLWLWALDNAPDGDLTGFGADELAEVAGWTGRDPGRFVRALAEAGFLDAGPEGALVLHDWSDYAGRLMEQREQARLRKQRQRQREQLPQ